MAGAGPGATATTATSPPRSATTSQPCATSLPTTCVAARRSPKFSAHSAAEFRLGSRNGETSHDHHTTFASGLAGLAGSALLGLPIAARAEGTLEATKKRGTLPRRRHAGAAVVLQGPEERRLDVRRRHLDRQGDGRRPRRQDRAGRGDAGARDRRAAGQQDRHDVDDGRHARAQAGGRLPEDAAALLLARRAGAATTCR